MIESSLLLWNLVRLLIKLDRTLNWDDVLVAQQGQEVGVGTTLKKQGSVLNHSNLFQSVLWDGGGEAISQGNSQ
jgi:hypothetical protein